MVKMDNYKILEITADNFIIKNRFYVYQLERVDRHNQPRYRLIKQCYSRGRALEYISSLNTN